MLNPFPVAKPEQEELEGKLSLVVVHDFVPGGQMPTTADKLLQKGGYHDCLFQISLQPHY